MSRVREPAGLWLEGCGGWDDQDQHVASRWWAMRDLFESDSDSEGGGGGPQPQPGGAAAARSAAAAPASPSGSPAPAPASRGVQAEVIDLVDDEEEEEEEVPAQRQQRQQQPEQAPELPPAVPPHHSESPEPPAAAARLRRITRKQTQPAAQQQRAPRLAPQLEEEEAQPLSRGGAARVPQPEESEEEADEKAWHLPGHQWVLRGDIGTAPPHRPRDLLVLNTVIPYRRQFRAVTRAYQRRMQGELSVLYGTRARRSCWLVGSTQPHHSLFKACVVPHNLF